MKKKKRKIKCLCRWNAFASVDENNSEFIGPRLGWKRQNGKIEEE